MLFAHVIGAIERNDNNETGLDLRANIKRPSPGPPCGWRLGQALKSYARIILYDVEHFTQQEIEMADPDC